MASELASDMGTVTDWVLASGPQSDTDMATE
jgi:hypothetical protein